jgi:hypothetical protein
MVLRAFIGLSFESLDELSFTERAVLFFIVVLEQVVDLDVLEG